MPRLTHSKWLVILSTEASGLVGHSAALALLVLAFSWLVSSHKESTPSCLAIGSLRLQPKQLALLIFPLWVFLVRLQLTAC